MLPATRFARRQEYIGTFSVVAILALAGIMAPSLNAADFAISVSPSSQTIVQQGGGVSYIVTLTCSGGFKSNVTVATTGLPAGAIADQSTVACGSSVSDSVLTANTTPLGSYVLTFTGNGGGIQHSTTATLVVNPLPPPDFSVLASPSVQGVIPGSATTYTISIGSVGVAVNLRVMGLPSGATATLTPASITGSGSSTMTITTASNTAPGTYYLIVSGVAASVTHSATVVLGITPDFFLWPTPPTYAATWNFFFNQWYPSNYTMNLSSLGGFNGTVNLTVSGLPPGATSHLGSSTLTGSGSTTLTVTAGTSTPYGTYTIAITGSSGSAVRTTSVTFIVSSCQSSDTTAYGAVLSSSPASQTIVQGMSASYTITSTPCGYQGLINLIAGPPTGGITALSPPSITERGTSTLTITTTASTPVGTYGVGAGGSISAVGGSEVFSNSSATLVVNAPTNQFSLSSSPTSQTIVPGTNTTYTIIVTAGRNFNSTVSFSANGLPTGVTATFNPTSVTGSGSTTMTLTAAVYMPAGTYSVRTVGTSGTLVNFTAVSLTLINPTLSGQVKVGTQGLAGVTVNVTGSQTASSTTDSNGNYVFSVPAGGSYTIEPSLARYAFTPPSANFSNVTFNQTANFTAIAAVTVTYTYDALGRLVSVTNSGVGTATYTYDAAGNVVSITRQ